MGRRGKGMGRRWVMIWEGGLGVEPVVVEVCITACSQVLFGAHVVRNHMIITGMSTLIFSIGTCLMRLKYTQGVVLMSLP